MRPFVTCPSLLILGVTAVLLAGCSPKTEGAGKADAAADGRQAVAGPPGRASDKLYAFAGKWGNDNVVVGLVGKGVIPLNPRYEAIRAQLEADKSAGIPLETNEPRCIPNGPIMGSKFSFEVYPTDNRLTVLVSRFTRYIDIDRPHSNPDELFDTISGESVARWDGDTLVIDTIGLAATNEIDVGIPNSGKLHTVERWTILPDGRLEVKWTVEDPGALTKPWNFTMVYSRRPPSTAVDQGYCVLSQDRTKDKETGKTGFDLTPPSDGYVPPDAQ